MVTSNKTSPSKPGRLWHTPTAKAALYWSLLTIFYCLFFYIIYFLLLRSKSTLIKGPFFDTIFRCGVMSYIMILVVSAYSLRTRFMRGLPWKAQSWVWMHMFLGLAALALALLHADFRFILHFNCSGPGCITDKYLAMPALYALIYLSLSGAIGRLLDRWQTRIIAQDASSNGVGIAKAIKGRLLELEYVVERYNAGKSDPFKAYCTQAINSIGTLPTTIPPIPPAEQADFGRAYQALQDHARLAASLHKQERAFFIFRTWRKVHMLLVPLALLVISYHGIAELIRVLTGAIHTTKGLF